MPILTTIQTNLRLELSDAAAFWSNDELARAVGKTESLLSRAIPKKAVYEATLVRTITSASFTVASSTGTTAYKPIKFSSEKLYNAAGTLMVRDTNYAINYMTGVITEIGALLPDATTYVISYDLDPQRFDLGSLLTNPLRITRVEYPVGEQPPAYLPNFDLINGFLIFGKDTQLTTGKHIRIYYDAMWVGAGAATGEYPENLADAVTIGAAGQALLMKAEKYVQSSITELSLVNAAADSMATPLADINTALDKVVLYLVTGTTAVNALTAITTDAANLRTAIKTALDKAAIYLIATTAPAAHKYLDMGDAFIETVNVAEDVAAKYADYARACVQIYSGLVAEATTRLDNIRTYIEEAAGWDKIAEEFIDEATQRVAEVNAWATQADKYTITSREYLTIAGRYLASGQAKINEFYALIGNKPEIQQVRTNLNQPTTY